MTANPKIDSKPVSLLSAADLSTYLFRFGKVTSTGINLCTTPGEKADGIIGAYYTHVPAAGDAIDFYVDRMPLIESGASYAAGVDLTTDSLGRAVAAGTGDVINGRSVDAATAAGQYLRVLPPYVKTSVLVVADAQALAGGLHCYTFNIADGATANYDIVVTAKFEVLDVVTIKTVADGGAGDQVIVQNGATAITDAISMNHVHKTVTRNTQIDEAHNVIAAAGTLRAAVTKATNGAVKILVIGVLRA